MDEPKMQKGVVCNVCAKNAVNMWGISTLWSTILNKYHVGRESTLNHSSQIACWHQQW